MVAGGSVVRGGAPAAGFSPPPQPRVKAAQANPAATPVRMMTLMARSLRSGSWDAGTAPRTPRWEPGLSLSHGAWWPFLLGLAIYSKGKLVREAGIDTYYFLVSAKRAL